MASVRREAAVQRAEAAVEWAEAAVERAEAAVQRDGIPFLPMYQSAQATLQAAIKQLNDLKASGSPSTTLDGIFGQWESQNGSFVQEFRDRGGQLPTTSWGIPAGAQGQPRLLLHKLRDKWTKNSQAWQMLEAVKNSAVSGCIPLMGVTGCGKTRTLYEILAENWGFFWTASSQRNGGSQDVSTIAQAHRSRRPRMLRGKYDFSRSEFDDLWSAVCTELSCKPILVVDEAQHLRSGGVFQSPESGQLRGRFSPITKALLSLNTAVCVAGTGISFLQLEDALASCLAKTANERAVDVDEFCQRYLSFLRLTAANCGSLFERFKGRKRCLVTCLELLMKNGSWSKAVVDEFYVGLTSRHSKDYKSSLYTLVSQFFQNGKGTFRICRGRDLSAAEVVRRAATHYYFSDRAGLVLDTAEADLVASGIGWCKMLQSWGTRASYEIFEPMVLDAMLNYCMDNDGLERYIQNLMESLKDCPSTSCGNLWEKLVVFHLPGIFDGKKPLKSWSCFQDLELGRFGRLTPIILGQETGVWRESPTASLSDYLQHPPNKRPMFFMFTSLSGPDVMCFVTWGNLVIPVFLQLKLRYRVEWDRAEGTTNPSRMYSRTSKEITSASQSKLLDACRDGCISLVVAYPASNPKPPAFRGKRLVGYLGRKQVEEMFSSDLCALLEAIKPEVLEYKRYREEYKRTGLRSNRVRREEFDVFQSFQE